ncbi:hypothetical protein H5410_063722 [Solanum commersonii]|uniref:Uncharacterized protein n=1 Tax=Solanum commersonii TaxID=4109 RepID=A0A9J5WFD3_SOLCO|nr:hypothetical protein H5410_063722 [Solanum commersonii]
MELSFTALSSAVARKKRKWSGTPEVARSMLVHRRQREIFWPSGTPERMESIGVPGCSQES